MSERLSPTRVAAIWAAALVLLAVAAVSVIILVNHTVFGPGQKVRDFQAHLAAGEGAQALGLLNATVPEGNGLLLDGDGLRAASADVKDFTVGKPEPIPGSGKVVQVTASYTVHGTAQQTSYSLQSAGRRWLFFDRWAFVPSILPAVEVSANTTNAVDINAMPAPLENGRTTVPVFAPSVINAGFETPNFAADSRGMVVTDPNAQGTEVKLRTEPTKALVEEVNGQIKKYLDDCASQQVLMPASCPMSYSTSARVNADSIHWSILEYPQAEIVPYNGEWALRPLTVKTRLKVTEQDLRTGASAERSIDEDFGFTAELQASTTKARVVPVASE
ncbi:hypothetical protein [Paeniglutamicibacter kerguelensis]|uniref:Uncharacterized protein n=1 Tax=Paeniglutamicibacter kerguelensis TaxID=254788 RepID=A0ABS4XFZ1_9MICC|nr:hypothetical protein [Paeniglutamicibacter kerguelensis]MBP2387221.1 hypothetical protein [Paeniglutamicibacter kerguelensis]